MLTKRIETVVMKIRQDSHIVGAMCLECWINHQTPKSPPGAAGNKKRPNATGTADPHQYAATH